MPREANFSEETRDVVAKRAAFRCSVPDCGQLTVGPGASDSESACIGQCCHIYSSSPDGPRGAGGLAAEQRASASNAFWACANHGKLIDTNDGDRFPARLLRSWKDGHEAMVLQELRGVTLRYGWVESIAFESVPVEQIPNQIPLGKLTVFRGGNGSGKTTVCECLGGLASPAELWRWRQGPSAQMLDFRVVYRTPEKHELRLRSSGSTKLLIQLDGRDVPILPFPFKVVHCRAMVDKQRPDECDVAYVARVLHLDDAEIVNLLPHVTGNSIFGVQRLLPIDGLYGLDIVADVSGTYPGLRFRVLSGSEQARAIHAVAVACAQFCASLSPTLLLLDAGVALLDHRHFGEFLRVVRSDRHIFQTVVTVSREQLKHEWDELCVVDFDAATRNAV